MTAHMAIERFTTPLFELLDETFQEVHGLYLDGGTSLFETLAGISAEQASRPVGGRCATLAAQVKHVRFYLCVLQDSILGKTVGKVDWGEIWRTTRQVSPSEWEALKRQLHDTYQEALATLKGRESWEGENDIPGALAILAHTAYHLGEIRQALCVVQ